jgi:RHS repeat-associated protein
MSGTEFQTGEWGLEGLDLNYFAARYYDPILGRWHAPDPLEQCHSPYLAMLGDPANFIDPDGRAGIPFLQDFMKSDGGTFLLNLAGQAAFLGAMLSPLGSIGGTLSNIVSVGASLYSAGSSVKNLAEFTSEGSTKTYARYDFSAEYSMMKSSRHAGMAFDTGQESSSDPWHEENGMTVSDEGDNIYTLITYVESTFDTKIELNGNLWNNGNYQGEGMHSYQLYNTYKNYGGKDASLRAGEVRIPNYVIRTGIRANSMDYNFWDASREITGITLIELGQPNQFKPRGGISGGGKSGIWTSRASLYMRKLDREFQSNLIKKGIISSPKALPFRILSTGGFGAAAGRAVPILGWGILAYDVYDNWEFISQIANSFSSGLEYHGELQKQNSTRVCFSGETKVLTPQGLKCIGDLNLGDEIVSYSLESGLLETHNIKTLYSRCVNDYCVIHLNTSETILVTSEHPFYVIGKGWMKVKELNKNDAFYSLSKDVRITLIEEVHISLEVFNIEVSENHNYFVSNSKVLVHNK